ncbi:inverse autotransporter beta domain-containing protein [Salidesulfovibrio brasiliensis]|uniref:inverse autotransporter beta domain-containing protein n=1 Tax=Salidesulfovibrio brasiliensis TaxID=221711 RepID=UPI0006D1FAFE|nr:inverse autotransporter beta-barrel domain-containing protein [Salidesulfovibrio brasiliensis]
MRIGCKWFWAALLVLLNIGPGCTWMKGADFVMSGAPDPVQKESTTHSAEELEVNSVCSEYGAGGEKDKRAETMVAALGYMRPKSPTSYHEVAKKLGLDAEKIAYLNFADDQDDIVAGEQIIVPLASDDLWQNVSESELLKVHSAVNEDYAADWSGKIKQNIKKHFTEDQLASELQYALREVKTAVDTGQVSQPEELGMRYARLAGRAFIDASVDEARELPRVKTITVEYKLPLGGEGSVNADALVALHELDEDGNFVFSQLGGRYKKDRFIGNLGVGYRKLSFDETLVWGVNAFYDYDFMGGHSRGGVGAEIKTELLDVYSNYYFPLSPWKKAYDHKYLEERAAEGFDFGLTGRLPFLKSVDWKTRYYKWYGKNVDVYGDDKYLSSPDGIEFGALWTPWDSIKLGVTHSRAIGSNLQETSLEASFSLTFEDIGSLFENPKDKAGVSLHKRMNELVSRQNDIVYERRVSAEGQALGIVIVKFGREN